MILSTAVNLMAVTVYRLHSGSGAGSLQWQAWQIVNLVGAPLVAVMFLTAWIDDLARWAHARHETSSDYRGSR